MTSNPYGITTSIGSQSFQGFVNAPIGGPLNSNQYPLAMLYHSYGTLIGQRPTPPQFYPSQEPVNADMNTNARYQYARINALSVEQRAEQKALGKLSRPITKVISSTQRQVPVSSHMNYIEPLPSSMHTTILKSIAVGKTGYKSGLPLRDPISTKSFDTNFRRTALQRARSGGCRAPRKKSSIYNYNLTQPGICAWGTIPRQNY